MRRKREIFEFYADAIGDLPGISLMPEASWGRATRWLSVITVDPAQFGTTSMECMDDPFGSFADYFVALS